jgi:GMP synthase-like glutamine amidotransferase
MRFLVFQHHPVEHPGSFRTFLRRDGVAWDAVELDAGQAIPDLAGYDALLVFGGPMDVWEEEAHPWLVAEKAAIRRFVCELDRPFLGVCLGHQLLASALGSPVGKMREPEVGVTNIQLTDAAATDPLFQDFPRTLPTLQWHGAEVKSLPPDGVTLAMNGACPIQAMRVGEHAYGLQYHMEPEETTIGEWGRVPEYRSALEAVGGAGAQRALKRAVKAEMPTFLANASALYQGFRDVVRRASDARGAR